MLSQFYMYSVRKINMYSYITVDFFRTRLYINQLLARLLCTFKIRIVT